MRGERGAVGGGWSSESKWSIYEQRNVKARSEIHIEINLLLDYCTVLCCTAFEVGASAVRGPGREREARRVGREKRNEHKRRRDEWRRENPVPDALMRNTNTFSVECAPTKIRAD